MIRYGEGTKTQDFNLLPSILLERERERESVWVCVCVYFKRNKQTNHEYTFTCIKENTAHLRSWAQRLNAGAFGCGQLACSQSWCPCTPEGLTGPFLQRALPRCRRNGQVRENALTPQLGERVWMNTPENPTSEKAEQGDAREGPGLQKVKATAMAPVWHPVTADFSPIYLEPHPAGMSSHHTPSDTWGCLAFTLLCVHKQHFSGPKQTTLNTFTPQLKVTHLNPVKRTYFCNTIPSLCIALRVHRLAATEARSTEVLTMEVAGTLLYIPLVGTLLSLFPAWVNVDGKWQVSELENTGWTRLEEGGQDLH